MRAYSRLQCGTCEIYARALDDSRSRGFHIDGEAFNVNDVEAAPLQIRGTPVEVFGTVPPKRQLDANGHEVTSLPSQGAFHFTVSLVRSTGGWQVNDIRIDDN